MHAGRLPGIFLLICLLLVAGRAYGEESDVGGSQVSISRITSDGRLKDGAVISADGSTIAWFQQGEGYSDLLMVAPAAAAAAPGAVLATDPKTDYVNGLQGPRYTAGDSMYHVSLRTQHIAISADGGVIALEAIEYFSGGWLYGWIVVNTGTGEARFVPEAYPAGMGVRAYNTYGGAQSVGEGYFALSGDGRTILFVADGHADSGVREALVALDVASGQARRVAGYTSLTAAAVSESDPKGCCSGPWVSPTGTKVAFSTYDNWTTDLYAGDFGSNGGAPKRLETLQVGSTPRFTAAGEYLTARFPSATTSTFWPTAGGDPIQMEHRDVFAFPFYDGQIGLVEVPVWTTNTQEIRIVRPDGATVLLRPGDKGLPAGWSFAVPSLSSNHRWVLADAYGRKVLLSLMSADGQSQDLYLLTLPTAGKPQIRIVLKINSPAVRIGDQTITLDVAPVIENGRTLVPLRFIGEQLGATVAWDQTERRATYTKGDRVIQIWIGREEALVDGQPFRLDVPAQIVNGRTMVPLRFVAQALDATADWNGETSEVTITAR